MAKDPAILFYNLPNPLLMEKTKTIKQTKEVHRIKIVENGIDDKSILIRQGRDIILVERQYIPKLIELLKSELGEAVNNG